MTTSADEAHGAPYVEVPAKRVADTVPLRVRWHDYLINLWEEGAEVASGFRVRLIRARSTGLQYRATTSGFTGRNEPRWPISAGETVLDGTVTWIAEAIDANSLRAPVSANSWTLPSGLTAVGAPTVDDLVYSQLVSGGSDGTTYSVKHAIELDTGEIKEAEIILPVRN